MIEAIQTFDQIRSMNMWESTGEELYQVIRFCEDRAKNNEQREKAMAEAVAEHWELLQAEAVITARIAELDGEVQHNADRACEFIDRFGFDYKDRKVMYDYVDGTNKTRKQLVTELFALVHKRRRLCNRSGIEFCR